MVESDFSGTILVVSDDPHIRAEAVNSFVSDATVWLAADSREASTILETTDPDLVLIDIQTGSAGGFGLRKDMSQIPRLASVPTIMLLERKQDEWLARQSGASVIRVKPIDVDDLLRIVRDTLAARAAELEKAEVKPA